MTTYMLVDAMSSDDGNALGDGKVQAVPQLGAADIVGDQRPALSQRTHGMLQSQESPHEGIVQSRSMIGHCHQRPAPAVA